MRHRVSASSAAGQADMQGPFEEVLVSVKLNRAAYDHAQKLVTDGKVVHDERDAWSEHQPSADEENEFLDEHGLDEYAKWYLGEDEEANEETKGHYKFPYGDFRRVHRCGVISAESRAGQNDYTDIRDAAAQLLRMLDEQK
jgi:hypothetical protein